MKLKENFLSIVKDFILNVIATMLPLVVLMFLIYPKLSSSLGVENYGISISLYGYSQMILGILIANLGYSRLLSKASLNSLKLTNYSAIFYLASIFNILFFFLLVQIMNIELDLIQCTLFALYLFIMGYNRYLIIEYRINKEFNKTLFYSLRNYLQAYH